MPLADADKKEAVQEFAEQIFVRTNKTANLATDEILAAIEAIDAFLSANAAAINNAFPEAFRTTATVRQKAELVAFVVKKRINLTAKDG